MSNTASAAPIERDTKPEKLSAYEALTPAEPDEKRRRLANILGDIEVARDAAMSDLVDLGRGVYLSRDAWYGERVRQLVGAAYDRVSQALTDAHLREIREAAEDFLLAREDAGAPHVSDGIELAKAAG